MLRQDRGGDKTNIIARAPKVILSAGEKDRLFSGKGMRGENPWNWRMKA
jgi:hypothetical protein